MPGAFRLAGKKSKGLKDSFGESLGRVYCLHFFYSFLFSFDYSYLGFPFSYHATTLHLVYPLHHRYSYIPGSLQVSNVPLCTTLFINVLITATTHLYPIKLLAELFVSLLLHFFFWISIFISKSSFMHIPQSIHHSMFFSYDYHSFSLSFSLLKLSQYILNCNTHIIFCQMSLKTEL